MEFISALPPPPPPPPTPTPFPRRFIPYLRRYLNGPLKLELFSIPLHSRLILLD